jgi:nitrogen regulatory protein PII
VARLITAILYQGGGAQVLRTLKERGVVSAGLHHARGSAIGDPAEGDGLPRSFEKEVLQVLVEDGEVDDILELIFDTAQVDRTHGGFLYVEKIGSARPLSLPKDLPEEKESA